MQTGSDVKYFLADHLDSTNGLADSTGAITASTSYDSFGNPTNVSFPSRYQYTGREFDNFTGLQFSRARIYDPKLGRFISQDPIGFGGRDINLYAYVANNPIKYRDSSGLSVDGGILIGVTAGEALLHYWLFNRATNLFPEKCDPHGRKRHCYVNCMSNRFHLFNPAIPTLFSLGQEARTLVPSVIVGGFNQEFRESIGDWQANVYGQQSSIKVWNSCYVICEAYNE